MVAVGPDLDPLADHRRNPERVGRAAGVPLATVRESNHKRGGRRREGVGEVDVAVADADKVVIVQPDEGLVDGFGRSTLEVCDEFFEGNWTAPVQEGSQNPLGQRCLPGGTSRQAPAFHVEGDEFICRQDHQIRHSRHPPLIWTHDKVCSSYRLKDLSARGQRMDATGRIAIGRLAKHTGTNVETIRYYERMGLWTAPPRSEGGYRLYGTEHLKRLHFIRRARLLGFSIGEIRTLLRLADERKRPCADVRAVADAHLKDVRAKIADLRRMERVLKATVARCTAGKRSDCPLIEALYQNGSTLDLHGSRGGPDQSPRP